MIQARFLTRPDAELPSNVFLAHPSQGSSSSGIENMKIMAMADILRTSDSFLPFHGSAVPKVGSLCGQLLGSGRMRGEPASGPAVSQTVPAHFTIRFCANRSPALLSSCLFVCFDIYTLLQGDWLLSNAASSALGHMVLLKPYMPARSALHVSASVFPPGLCGCAARCATYHDKLELLISWSC